MNNKGTPGIIIRSQAGFFLVQTDQGSWLCQLRGRLKRTHVDGDVATVGDRVWATFLQGKEGIIESVEPRTSALIRKAPTPKGEYRQIILANLDQVMFIFACAQPDPHLRMLDRFLVIAEKQGVPAVIIANKADLISPAQVQDLFGPYPKLGYSLIVTSARSGQGVEEMHRQLAGKITAFSGPSGVGKSSLLNAIQVGLSLAVQDISETTNKGRHTTVVRQLFALDGGGYVADTPGIRSLSLWDTHPEELDGYFPELRGLVEHCQFNDCTHRVEPGCAVQAAVAEGQVSRERYNSYLRMRFGEER